MQNRFYDFLFIEEFDEWRMENLDWNINVIFDIHPDYFLNYNFSKEELIKLEIILETYIDTWETKIDSMLIFIEKQHLISMFKIYKSMEKVKTYVSENKIPENIDDVIISGIGRYIANIINKDNAKFLIDYIIQLPIDYFAKTLIIILKRNKQHSNSNLNYYIMNMISEENTNKLQPYFFN